MHAFRSVKLVPVVDRTGKPTGEVREIRNPQIDALFPGEPVVLVSWKYEGADAPDTAELTKPIHFQDKVYQANWAWGSSVKHGFTIGLTHDLATESGLFTYAEDVYRFGRAFMSNGLYGAGKGDVEVDLLPEGAQTKAGPISDGFGYIRRSLAEKLLDPYMDPIELGPARDSLHWWQRIPWSSEVAAESQPFIDQALVEAADPSNPNFWLLKQMGTTANHRRELTEIEPLMLEHPYVVNMLQRSSADALVRMATTVPTSSMARIAVPANVSHDTDSSRHIVARYPLDAFGSMQAVESNETVEAEAIRVAGLEVVQYGLTSMASGFFAKGLLGIVDDDLLDTDIVMCSEDCKTDKSTRRQIVEDGVISFTQYFGKNTAVGMNADFFKRMGGDFDGDLVIVTDCTDRPALWQAVANFPEQPTIKLIKTRSPLTDDAREGMIVRSMMNLVGMAVNLMAATFAVSDREGLAKGMGYKSALAMDNQMNFWIKVGTDLFKTSVDSAQVQKGLSVFQNRLLDRLGRLPAYLRWPNDWAFTHAIPPFRYTGDDRTSLESRNSIPPNYDGTIAKILEITLPQIGEIFRENLAIRPLHEYQTWAAEVADVHLGQAALLQKKFNARVQSVNWEWDEDALAFGAWWNQTIQEWTTDEGLDYMTAASALWRVAHDARSPYNGAASVFMGFPEAVKSIVRDKPGINEPVFGVLLGMPEGTPDFDITRARVAEFTRVDTKSGRHVRRKCLVPVDVSFSWSLADTGVHGAIAVFAPDLPVPQTGITIAVAVRQRTRKSWFADCYPIS